METLSITAFKSSLSAVLERVRRTGEPVPVTRRGKLVAKIIPAPVAERPRRWLGCLRDRGQILGDLVTPAVSEDEWEALGQS